ncbi:carbohydrate-binding protein [Actinoplanes sp. NPDC049599]|uniref:carbohydrate-binding protein n=1 Tax=Actinoplanes sp. NPDC049599 TaxID=3363903 RepID=UPI003789D2DA
MSYSTVHSFMIGAAPSARTAQELPPAGAGPTKGNTAVKERQESALIRPYVLESNDEPGVRAPGRAEQPRDPGRWEESTPAGGAASPPEPGPVARPGETPPEEAPSTSHRRARSGARRSTGASRPTHPADSQGMADGAAGKLPASRAAGRLVAFAGRLVTGGVAGKPLVGGVAGKRPAGMFHRNRLVAASSVLAVAVVILVVQARDPGVRPEQKPKVEGISGWFTPAPLVPGAAAPSQPAGGSPGPSPEDTRTAVPDDPPPYVPAGDPPGAKPAKPGATSSPAGAATAYTTIQAESFDEQNGIRIEAAESGPGRHIGFITSGDWVRYDAIDFTDTPASALQISAANWAKENRTGEVELRLDSRSRAPIGTLTIPNNGNWFAFTTYVMAMKPTTGVHTVYLTFTSTQTEEYANIDWIRFRH